MSIKNNDFIELDYTGYINGTTKIFDTTIKEVAEKSGLHKENMEYKPIIIAVGNGDVVAGLDESLISKKPGKYEIVIPAEKGFGMKNPKLMKKKMTLCPKRLVHGRTLEIDWQTPYFEKMK